MMTVAELAVLIVLIFVLWTLSTIVIIKYERRSKQLDTYDAADKFSGEPARSGRDEPPPVVLPPREVKIETSFGDERIGKL